MAQITIYAQTASMNWDAANGWNTISGGGGTAYTDPQNGTDTFICDLNSKTVVLNKNATVDIVKSTTATGFLTVSATRTLTAAIQYSSTSTSGMVQVSGAGVSFTTTSVSNTSTGYALLCSATGTLTINAGTGNTAVTNSGSGNGRAVHISGAATLSVTGNVVTGGVGFCIVIGAAVTATINGNVSDSGSTYANAVWNNNASAVVTINGTVTCTSTSTTGLIVFSAGTVTINDTVSCSSSGYAVVPTGATTVNITKSGGTAISNTGSGSCLYKTSASTSTITGAISNTGSGNGSAIYMNHASASCTVQGNISNSVGMSAIRFGNGTVNWLGTRTLAANTECFLNVAAGTLALATGASALTLSTAGTLVIVKASGATLTTTAAGGTAAFVRSAAGGNVACSGTDISGLVSGPTLPTASNVWTGTGTYGYADSLTTPTKRASSITNCTAGNVKNGVVIDDVTGTYVGASGGGGSVVGSSIVRAA